MFIHIGVGSNVVRSTIPGNAKALVRGTDNKQFPRLFYAFNFAKEESQWISVHYNIKLNINYEMY